LVTARPAVARYLNNGYEITENALTDSEVMLCDFETQQLSPKTILGMF
jgi:hypothetical protein